MYLIHQAALYLHIAVGACALLLFWVPVFTRKGNLDHKRFGRYFATAMYVVAFSGIAMASLDLLLPLDMHGIGLELVGEEADDAKSYVRNFALFLLSLSFLVLTTTRQGWLAILHKADRGPLRHPLHSALCITLMAVGLALLINGIATGSILFILFAGLEIVAGINCLRYNFKATLEPKEWWIEHLNGLIGSGIGAYTAFTVFGGSRLFSSLFTGSFADAAIVLWIAPGVIGAIAITVLSRRYRARFGGSWAIKRATFHSDLVR